jgi:multicomponent Na+:H+ antiporter subunit D
MILASLITLAYFLIMQRRVFFGKLRLGLEGIREADIWITIPSVALTLVIVGVGLLMPWLFGSFLVRIWNGVIS